MFGLLNEFETIWRLSWPVFRFYSDISQENPQENHEIPATDSGVLAENGTRYLTNASQNFNHYTVTAGTFFSPDKFPWSA
jgi:hypothetical protein